MRVAHIWVVLALATSLSVAGQQLSDLSNASGGTVQLPTKSYVLQEGQEVKGAWQVTPAAPGAAVNLSAVPNAGFLLTAGSQLKLSGITIVGNLAAGLVPSIITVMAPDARLSLQNVTLATTQPCTQLFQQICSFHGANAEVLLHTNSSLGVRSFMSQGLDSSDTTIRCAPGQDPLLEPQSCAGAVVSTGQQLGSALERLQQNFSMVTLSIQQDPGVIRLGETPNNLNITKHVIIQGPEQSEAGTWKAWIDMEVGARLISIHPPGHVELRNLGMYNLPMGPPTQFMASSFVGYLWNFNFPRVTGTVTLTLTNLALTVPDDLYRFLTHWYTNLKSPIPRIQQSASWLLNVTQLTNATLDDFKISASENAGLDVIFNSVRVSPGQLWHNVTIGPPESFDVVLDPRVNQTGVLDVPWDYGQFIAATQVLSVCTPTELLSGLSRASTNQPFVVVTCNASLAPTANSTVNTTGPLAPPPSTVPVTLQPTTLPVASILLQPHPLFPVAVNLDSQACIVQGQTGSTLRLRNLTLYNGGVRTAAVPSSAGFAPLAMFTSGLWAFCGLSNTDLFLQNVTIIVPPDELRLLQQVVQGAPCDCLPPATRQMLGDWNQASAFSVTDKRIKAAAWSGWRWSGTDITIMADPGTGPYTTTLYPGLQPSADAAVADQPATSRSTKSVVQAKPWLLPLCILVPLLMAAILALAIREWRAQRRAGQHVQADDDLAGASPAKLPSAPPKAGPVSDVESGHGNHEPCGGSSSAETTMSSEQAKSLDATIAVPRNVFIIHGSGNRTYASSDSTPPGSRHIASQSSPSPVPPSPHGHIGWQPEGAAQVQPAGQTFLDQDGNQVVSTGSQLELNAFRAQSGSLEEPSRCITLSTSASYWSGSHGLMSDSFDKPGSEYGDYSAVANLDMQSMLANIRSELSNASKLTIYGILGAGAHGVCWRGEWCNRPVAVKTLLFQEHVMRGRQQALQEVAVNSRFCHPNIINTYTYGLKPITETSKDMEPGSLTIDQLNSPGDYKLYIVQEFCDGGHLKKAVDSGQLVDATGRPDMLSVVQVALDLACGLQHIHFKHVIHGDLSPSNVLLNSDANRRGRLKAIAKVGDFGLSRCVGEESHVSGARQGTPYYTAPEVQLHGQLTRAADIFSFGVILHELYCGQPAWRRKIKVHASHTAKQRHGSILSTLASSLDLTAQLHTVQSTSQSVQGSSTPDGPQPMYDEAHRPSLPVSPTTDVRSVAEQDVVLGVESVHVQGSVQGDENVVQSDPKLVLQAVQKFMSTPEGSYPLPMPASCPSWYAELVAGCLQADPNQRPKLPGVVQLLMAQLQQLEAQQQQQLAAAVAATPELA